MLHGGEEPRFVLRRQMERRLARLKRKLREIAQPSIAHLLELHARRRIARGSAPLRRSVQENPIEHPELERAGVAHTGVTGIGGSVERNDRLQVFAPLEGDSVLCPSLVRSPEHADLAVGPRLLADPVACVSAVVSITGKHLPDALGTVSAASVL